MRKHIMTLRIEEVAVAAAVCFLSAAWYLRGQIAGVSPSCLSVSLCSHPFRYIRMFPPS